MSDNPRHIYPKTADSLCLDPGKATNQGKQHSNAGGGRYKVLHCQANSLRQIAQSRFTGIRLPVRVGYKAGGGVKS